MSTVQFCTVFSTTTRVLDDSDMLLMTYKAVTPLTTLITQPRMYTHATCTRPDHTTTHAHTPHALTHYTQSRLGLATGSFDFRPLHTTGDCTAVPFCVLRPKIPGQRPRNRTEQTKQQQRTTIREHGGKQTGVSLLVPGTLPALNCTRSLTQ